MAGNFDNRHHVHDLFLPLPYGTPYSARSAGTSGAFELDYTTTCAFGRTDARSDRSTYVQHSLPIPHRFREELGEIRLAARPRRQLGQPLLLQRAGDHLRDVGGRVADRVQTIMNNPGSCRETGVVSTSSSRFGSGETQRLLHLRQIEVQDDRALDVEARGRLVAVGIAAHAAGRGPILGDVDLDEGMPLSFSQTRARLQPGHHDVQYMITSASGRTAGAIAWAAATALADHACASCGSILASSPKSTSLSGCSSMSCTST